MTCPECNRTILANEYHECPHASTDVNGFKLPRPVGRLDGPVTNVEAFKGEKRAKRLKERFGHIEED